MANTSTDLSQGSLYHLVMEDAALRAEEEQQRFRAAVREGIAQADRGELIYDDEVLQWLEQQARS